MSNGLNDWIHLGLAFTVGYLMIMVYLLVCRVNRLWWRLQKVELRIPQGLTGTLRKANKRDIRMRLGGGNHDERRTN